MKRFTIMALILALSAMILIAFILPGVAKQQPKPDIYIIHASPGQTVSYTGQGTANSDVYVEVTTTTSINAPGGRYGISLNGIRIPSGTNGFSITASKVDTLTVSGSSLTNSQVSATQGVSVNNKGVGSLSKSNIPVGTYNLMIYGTTKYSKVDVSASAGYMIHVDGNGNYYGSISTQGMPAGIYKVKQDNKEIAYVYLGV